MAVTFTVPSNLENLEQAGLWPPWRLLPSELVATGLVHLCPVNVMASRLKHSSAPNLGQIPRYRAGARQGLGGVQHPLPDFPAPVLKLDLSTPSQHPLLP